MEKVKIENFMDVSLIDKSNRSQIFFKTGILKNIRERLFLKNSNIKNVGTSHPLRKIILLQEGLLCTFRLQIKHQKHLKGTSNLFETIHLFRFHGKTISQLPPLMTAL